MTKAELRVELAKAQNEFEAAEKAVGAAKAAANEARKRAKELKVALRAADKGPAK